ncbi:MAG: DUF3786 domain-containing protein [Anaerolineae bacterium]|nr:DUF3786 domain-containing protein [Anaerolineae bacterium]
MAVDLSETGLQRRVATLQQELALRETAVLAAKSGAKLVAGELELLVWGTAVLITTPDFIAHSQETGAVLDTMTQALLAYYLWTTDGTPPAGEWIAFTELPNGRFYTQAFQSYTGRELAEQFGNDMDWFRETAVAAGGHAVPFADAAFKFQVLPHVPLLVACWLGDEEFPPSYKILFDAHTSHHLPTDACAIIGRMITGRLLREGQKQ